MDQTEVKVFSSLGYNPFKPPGSEESRLFQWTPQLPGRAPKRPEPVPPVAAPPAGPPAEAVAGPPVETAPVQYATPAMPETHLQVVSSQGAARIVPPAATPAQLRSFG